MVWPKNDHFTSFVSCKHLQMTEQKRMLSEPVLMSYVSHFD